MAEIRGKHETGKNCLKKSQENVRKIEKNATTKLKRSTKSKKCE